MEKKCVIRLTAVLLCLLLLSGAAFPVCAGEQPAAEPTWQNYIESVTPVGGEAYLALELTPTGYIFTDYDFPREYDVVLKNGTTLCGRIPPQNMLDLYYDGYYAGGCFDVDTGDEVLTLYACVYFDPQTKQGMFELGQMTDDYYFFMISTEPCRAEIDDSSLIARILYPVYAVFEQLVLLLIRFRNSLVSLVK